MRSLILEALKRQRAIHLIEMLKKLYMGKAVSGYHHVTDIKIIDNGVTRYTVGILLSLNPKPVRAETTRTNIENNLTKLLNGAEVLCLKSDEYKEFKGIKKVKDALFKKIKGTKIHSSGGTVWKVVDIQFGYYDDDFFNIMLKQLPDRPDNTTVDTIVFGNYVRDLFKALGGNELTSYVGDRYSIEFKTL